MGILSSILIILLFAMVLLIIGLVKKSKPLKIISIIAFAISVGLFLFFWCTLSYQ